MELIIRIPHYHFQGGSPAPENWRRQQYIIIAMISTFTDLERFFRELQEGFRIFQATYPGVDIKAGDYSDPFG